MSSSDFLEDRKGACIGQQIQEVGGDHDLILRQVNRYAIDLRRILARYHKLRQQMLLPEGTSELVQRVDGASSTSAVTDSNTFCLLVDSSGVILELDDFAVRVCGVGILCGGSIYDFFAGESSSEIACSLSDSSVEAGRLRRLGGLLVVSENGDKIPATMALMAVDELGCHHYCVVVSLVRVTSPVDASLVSVAISDVFGGAFLCDTDLPQEIVVRYRSRDLADHVLKLGHYVDSIDGAGLSVGSDMFMRVHLLKSHSAGAAHMVFMLFDSGFKCDRPNAWARENPTIDAFCNLAWTPHFGVFKKSFVSRSYSALSSGLSVFLLSIAPCQNPRPSPLHTSRELEATLRNAVLKSVRGCDLVLSKNQGCFLVGVFDAEDFRALTMHIVDSLSISARSFGSDFCASKFSVGYAAVERSEFDFDELLFEAEMGLRLALVDGGADIASLKGFCS